VCCVLVRCVWVFAGCVCVFRSYKTVIKLKKKKKKKKKKAIFCRVHPEDGGNAREAVAHGLRNGRVTLLQPGQIWGYTSNRVNSFALKILTEKGQFRAVEKMADKHSGH